MNAYYEHVPQALRKDAVWKYPNAVKIYLYLKQRAETMTYTYSDQQAFTICSFEILTSEIGENGKTVSKSTIKRNVDRLVKQGLINVERLSYGTKFIIL